MCVCVRVWREVLIISGVHVCMCVCVCVCVWRERFGLWSHCECVFVCGEKSGYAVCVYVWIERGSNIYLVSMCVCVCVCVCVERDLVMLCVRVCTCGERFGLWSHCECLCVCVCVCGERF